MTDEEKINNYNSMKNELDYYKSEWYQTGVQLTKKDKELRVALKNQNIYEKNINDIKNIIDDFDNWLQDSDLVDREKIDKLIEKIRSVLEKNEK